jgi:hypothetical protein
MIAGNRSTTSSPRLCAEHEVSPKCPPCHFFPNPEDKSRFCFIASYKNFIQNIIDEKKDIKKEFYALIKNRGLWHESIYMKKAIELYFPHLLDTFNMLMILV